VEKREPDPKHEEAMRPIYEAGGGESEGFEDAEEELIENAEYTSGEGAPRLEEEWDEVEAEPDPATYSEADEEERPDA
jgi:hypothetical protein